MTGAIRILHVDDEADVVELAAGFLEREDDRFDVATETSAADGLDHLADDGTDCVVSDYQMPGMDGLQFLGAVREHHPELPFILFTGRGSEEVASDALSRGATDYLQKGTGSEQYELLANRIENAVERHRARERAAALERVRSVVRDVNQALVRASSRAEIETRMCEIVSEPDPVSFAVFSAVDPETDRVDPRAWAGVDGGAAYLDAVAITVDGSTDAPGTPHERAVREGEVAASPDLQADPAFDPWREAVAESGFRSLAVVPIAYEGELYGLFALYGDRPRPVDDARDLLEELGDDIAHAINAVETRKELAESEARYRNLAETASDAIVRIDDESTITYANPATSRLFGYGQAELHGASLTKLMPERLRDRHRDGVARYLRTGDRRLDWTGVELPGRHQDGTEIPLSITFGEFELDGEQFFTGIIRDVTERAERKAELRRRVEDLDEFAGTVAHDLRTPLNVLAGRLDLLEAECDSEHIDAAIDTLGRMEDLIENLLVLAQGERAVDDAEPVALADVVETARRAVDDGALAVETDLAVGTVAASPAGVRALVENLFRNAVEHGGPGVTIRVETIEDGFAIEDDGPGIAADEREAVFEPGYTTKEGGTGFGLNSVRKIVDAHGWDVAVTRGADGGARFEITGVEVDR